MASPLDTTWAEEEVQEDKQCGCSVVAARDPSKVLGRVRVSSSAPVAFGNYVDT